MISRPVALGGPPGSGTTSAGRLVAQALGLEYVSAGEEFRKEAARRGFELEAFGRYAEAHPEVDQELDRSMQSAARPGRLLEGRIQGVLCRRNHVPCWWVRLDAEEAERARRVAGRDRVPLEEALRAIRVREASERDRYLRFYGIDLDRETPDLDVDTTHTPADQVAERIVRFLREREGGAPG